MIKRIHKIKNFGVFQDYRRSGDIRDFEEKNIIYGWNYSGKTTLSRLVSYLDREICIEDDYKDIEFVVELSGGTKIDNDNRNTSPLHVKVFNADFIKDNLHFGVDEKMNGIKFALGETGDILDKINDIDDYITKANSKIERNQNDIKQFNSFESRFTNEARHLTELLGLGRNFSKANIKSLIQQWGDQSLDNYIIADSAEAKKILLQATSPKTGSVINIENKPSTVFPMLYEKVKEILETHPQPSENDELLSTNEDLFKWAKVGLDIYNSKHAQLQKCAFCGADLSTERLTKLNAFYSNEASKLKSEIDTIKQTICQEKQRFDSLEWSRKSNNDLINSCQADYSAQKNAYEIIKIAYLNLLDILISKLDEKYSNYLFVPMEIGEFDMVANSNMQNWILSTEAIFACNNQRIEDYSTLKEQSKKRYLEHYIASFLVNNNYREIERKKHLEENFIHIIEEAIKAKEIEKKGLNAQLESIEKGKNELENFIKLFLNREDLSITLEDNYFILKRGDKTAKHLSDGEKSAIALSHFMVVLKSLKDNHKLTDYIVFIDDPISSLDANHIAQVSSLLNTFFFEKGLDSANPDKVCNCFKQLFISTHNFEFFSFLRDANNINRKRKEKQDGRTKEVPACNYFMIKKIDVGKSEIINLPKSLSAFKSEYVFLFSEIDRFKQDGYPEDRAYMMPNIVRRFLEIYTLMKLPGNTDEIDNRIKILFSDRIIELKILHNFSHFTSFDRITRHSELVLRIQDVIEDLYKILESDEKHFQSLQEGIK